MIRVTMRNATTILAAVAIGCGASGCGAEKLVGGIMAAEEAQKLVDMPPQYAGLENKTVAVIVQSDSTTLYEFPDLELQIGGGVSARIARDVPGARVLNHQHVYNWQFRTPQWSSLPYGEMAEQLNVDRIVLIDVLEYRLNPPGNRWLWEGVCTARVGVIERDNIDPDTFVEVFDITVKFPSVSGVGRESASEPAVANGLLYKFVERTAWLFHQHLEPKYPDKYRPELDPRYSKKKK